MNIRINCFQHGYITQFQFTQFRKCLPESKIVNDSLKEPHAILESETNDP